MKVMGGTAMTLSPSLYIQDFAGVEVVVTDAYRKDGKPNSMRWIKYTAMLCMGYPKSIRRQYTLELVSQSGDMLKFRLVDRKTLGHIERNLLT